MPRTCPRGVTCPRSLMLVLLTIPWPASATAQIGMDLMRPPVQERSVEVRATLPMWVAMPQSARILTSEGLELRPLKNSAVTYENARLGVLVGALRNSGGCARDLSVNHGAYPRATRAGSLVGLLAARQVANPLSFLKARSRTFETT